MKILLIQNWFVILVLLVFIAYLVYLMVTKQWMKLKQQAYGLMLSAERLYDTTEGKEKFIAVFEKIYYYLIPFWLRVFVTEDVIKEKLQKWYDLMKDCLKD